MGIFVHVYNYTHTDAIKCLTLLYTQMVTMNKSAFKNGFPSDFRSSFYDTTSTSEHLLVHIQACKLKVYNNQTDEPRN